MKNIIVFIVLMAILVFAARSNAAIFHCATAQDLQTALSLSQTDGQDDTIYLAAGIYYGNFTYHSSEAQALSILGETNTLPGQVVLDGRQTGTVLVLNAGSAVANLSLTGVTIQNGQGAPGGLSCYTSASVTIQQCSILNNTGNGNSPSSEAGFYIFGANTVVLTQDNVSGNQDGYNSTGGFITSVGSISISHCTVQNNQYGEFSSGLDLSAGSVVFNNNQIQFNSNACAVFISTSAAYVTNNNFFNNSVSSDYTGPALFVTGQAGTLYGNVFSFNYNGSGGDFPNYPGAGAVVASCDNLLVQGNLFQENACGDGDAGALAISGYNSVVLVDNIAVSNSAENSAGAIYLSAGQTNYVANNTLYGNSAANGGGLYYNTGGTGASSLNYLDNNIIWGNTATTAGGDVFVVSGGSLRSLYNNDYHSMAGLWDVAISNIDVAPLFVDQLRGNFRLRANSLCINAGNNGAPGLPLIDYHGNVRVADGIVDMGAFEQSRSDWHPADVNSNWVMSGVEFTNYATAWLNSGAWSTGPNPIPIDYVTRAGFLFLTNGGAYTNLGGGKPLNWQP